MKKATKQTPKKVVKKKTSSIKHKNGSERGIPPRLEDHTILEGPVEGGCKCCEQINLQLKDIGLALDRSLMMDFSKGEASMSPPQIMLKLIPKEGRKLKTLFCAYCPFCGKKYE